jgi:hypothetical protein
MFQDLCRPCGHPAWLHLRGSRVLDSSSALMPPAKSYGRQVDRAHSVIERRSAWGSRSTNSTGLFSAQMEAKVTATVLLPTAPLRPQMQGGGLAFRHAYFSSAAHLLNARMYRRWQPSAFHAQRQPAERVSVCSPRFSVELGSGVQTCAEALIWDVLSKWTISDELRNECFSRVLTRGAVTIETDALSCVWAESEGCSAPQNRSR